MSDEQFILEVIWHNVDLPPLIGPFDSEQEASEWARLNVPNGTAMIRPLTYPYLRSTNDEAARRQR